MAKRLLRTSVITMLAIGLLLGGPPPRTEATHTPGFTTLLVGGEAVQIYRDEFWVPHIFAETNKSLFTAYGYTVAQDRLWQLEVNRRAARGRLAEIFGPSSLAADRAARTEGYTQPELDQQFARLSAAEQEIFSAYVDGINRYVQEVVVPDPANKLPFEFHSLKLGVESLSGDNQWTTQDAFAFAVFEARAFGEFGDGERAAQTLLNGLITAFGQTAGLRIFNDLRWINDPDAPTSVPVDGAFGRRQKDLPPPAAGQLAGSSGSGPVTPEEDPRAIWDALGVPTKLGSNGWVVSAAKSAEGAAMLFGAPGLDTQVTGGRAPALMHEVQLKGGDLNVAGMAFAGIPAVLIGRTDHLTWTSMSAPTANNVDIYVETLCSGETGYMFRGACTPFERRQETIKVKGGADVGLTVERSVHGPVVASATGVKFTRKSVQWKREVEDIRGGFARVSARNINEFKAVVEQSVGASHHLYADKVGNIAYWRAGEIPVRPPGFDIRLPLPGDGSAEWPGGLEPIPYSINPTRGWLANWNNKANVDEDSPAAGGKQATVADIEAEIKDRLEHGDHVISLQEMRDITKAISRVVRAPAGPGFRNSRFYKSYLLQALDAVPSNHPLAAQARAVLEAWDGSHYPDAVTSTTLEPAQVIFAAWLAAMRQRTFGDDLGPSLAGATGGTLLHVLDDALGGGSGVPPSRDYFNGANPNVVISAAYTDALNSLGPDPAAWSTRPRLVTHFRHVLFPPPADPVASIPDSQHMTYLQIVVLSNPTIRSENIFTLGQSGFIQGPTTPKFDPHFKDQLELYKNFGYKPMRLFLNTQLQEGGSAAQTPTSTSNTQLNQGAAVTQTTTSTPIAPTTATPTSMPSTPTATPALTATRTPTVAPTLTPTATPSP